MNAIKVILDHEHVTDRLRTRSLARQQWSKVIECDAVLDACKRLRAAIARDAERDGTLTQTQKASLPPATALGVTNPEVIGQILAEVNNPPAPYGYKATF